MTMLEPVAPWLRDLNRLFSGEATGPAALIPPADVIVTDEGVQVHMDVPGLKADDLEILLQADTLSVSGERPYPYAREGGERAWRHIERRFGRFERSLRVPTGLDPNQVDATLSDGVLSLWIPKPESLKPHHVPIRAQTNGSGRPQVQAAPSTGGNGQTTTAGEQTAAGGGAQATSAGQGQMPGQTPGQTPGQAPAS